MEPLTGYRRRRSVQLESPAPTAPSCSPTAARPSSKSNHRTVIRCATGRLRVLRCPTGEDGALFTFLAAGKHSVVADPRNCRRRRTRRRHCCRTSMRWCGLTARESLRHAVLSPPEIRRSHPHLTVTSITPFGLDGPWRDKPATEFTLQAWSGGIVGLGRGAPDRAPSVRRRPEWGSSSPARTPLRRR